MPTPLSIVQREKIHSKIETLVHSASRGALTALELLLESGDVHPSMLVQPWSEKRRPALHHAVVMSDNRLIRKILLAGGSEAIIDVPFRQQTPLELAVKSRCVHCTETILGARADPNRCWPKEKGMSPLRYAVEHCSLEMCKLLLDFGAEPLLLRQAGDQVRLVQV